jgi:cell shape-determining protein MreD
VSLSLPHRRTLVIAACGFVLWLIVSQANHYLAPARLYLWVGGLFVTFAGLRLAPQEGFNACFLTGLLLDAGTPVPFGLHAFLFGIAQLVLVRVRHRFAGEVTIVAVMVALLTNLALFLALSFTRMGHLPDTASAGLRLLVDLAFSQCMLALIGPWYFAFQLRALEITGAGLRVDAGEAI